MGIPAAGIRKDKNRAVRQGLVLQSDADSSGPVVWKQRAIDRYTKQGDPLRAIALYCGNKPLPSGGIFTRLERIDPRAGSLDDVRQAEAPLRQAPIVLVRQWLRYELRFEQEFPETVRETGEVMSGGS